MDATLDTRRTVKLLGAALFGVAGTAVIVFEKRRPLRPGTQDEPARTLRNLVLGAASMAVVAAVERPVTMRLAARADGRRRGLAQLLPGPAWVRDAAAVLAMDYTIYLWHVATHRIPLLWRFHLVHHLDMDLDASTALRFHVADMAISVPYRAAQVALLGVSPRALGWWQRWFFLSVLFHHSNLALPRTWERRLALVFTTPRMHAIHHSAAKRDTDSNWSSGFSIWDRLHRTFRLDGLQDTDRIGVPGYRDPAATRLGPSFMMPFCPQRDAWAPDAQALDRPGRTKPTARQ